MKNIKFIIAFSFLLIGNNLFASGGSIYTRFGVGDLVNSSSARVLSMGGLGYALQNYDYLSELNPANWSKIYSTRIEANFLMNNSSISDNNVKSNYSKGIFGGFKVGIPIERDLGASLVFGLTPETMVQYEIVNKVENSSIENYTTTYEGSGGLSRLFFGSSLKLPYNFVIGASFDYYFGTIEYSSSLVFGENSTLVGGSVKKKNQYHGIGYTFGLLSPDLSSVFGTEKIKDFRFGLALKYTANLTTDTLYYSGSLLGLKLIERTPVLTEMPYKLGMGLSFIWDENYLFIADYAYQPYSKYTLNNVSDNNLRDYHKVSLGIEHRNPVTRFSTFTEQIVLRAGLSYEKTQYNINGTGIDAYMLSTGLSFPLTFENTIDLGFMVGLRGKKENSLIKETIYNLSVSFSFGERWFIRQDR